MAIKYSQKGHQNLSNLEISSRFTEWTYEQIKPNISGRILEIGSGIGTYSKKIARDFPENQIILSEIDQEYIQKLKNDYKNRKNVSVVRLDVTQKSDFSRLGQKIDSALVLNVLEHIENDVDALNNIYDILNNHGKLVLCVPAHKFLFNCIDKAVGHHRRYSKKEIKEKVGKTKFKIKEIFYFNFLSIFGWYVNGNVLKKEIIDESKMKILDKLVPSLKSLEKNILKRKMGISLIVVLEK